MKCNARERYVSAKDKEIIKKLAMEGAISQIEQACNRTEAQIYISALNVGLSPRTINKIIEEKEKVSEGSSQYRKEKVMDFAMQKILDEKGIKFKIGCDEI